MKKKMKMKRYEEGGDVEFETAQGQNKNISDETRAKAMASVSKSDGESEETKYAKKLYSSENSEIPKKAAEKLTPKAAPKTTPKAEAPTPKEEPKAEPKAKANPVQQLKDVVKGKDVTAPSAKSFTEAGGSTKTRTEKVDASELGIKAPKLYDPLARFEQTGPKRSEAAAPKKKSSYTADHSMGSAMRKGGKVKSASSRADGCAIRGKTRA
jgi:hypothetical protein